MQTQILRTLLSAMLIIVVSCSSKTTPKTQNPASPGGSEPTNLGTTPPKTPPKQPGSPSQPSTPVTPTAPKSGEFIKLEDDLEYAFIDDKTLTLDPIDYKVHVFKIQQDKFKLKIVSFQEDITQYKSPQNTREELNARIVINGGFGAAGKPQNIADGTLLIEGKKISDANPKLSGVLAIEENKLRISETAQFAVANPQNPDTSAIQGNPLLVDRGGKLGIKSTTGDKRVARTAVCTLPSKEMLILVTDRAKSGIYLMELGRVGVKLGCDIAINLDGGPATALSVKSYSDSFKGIEIAADKGWVHPNEIVIE